MTRVVTVVAITVACLMPGSALAQKTDLGNIEFPTSTTSAEAQEHFLRGAMLIHSFEWEDAAEAFQEAQRADPDFVMAYWGEALSHTGGHHFSAEQDISDAREALSKLAPTRAERLAKAPTDRERAYLEAVEALYGAGDALARAEAYAERMAKLVESYPEDDEAATLYALALMRTVRQGEGSARKDMQAGAIAQRVMRENPDHPGAAHYVIHAFDDPIHAPIALHAALKYADIAPAAVHALHMPSHTFVQLGMWDRLALSNEASYQASVDRADMKGYPPTRRSFHALYWLHYAYLQQGRLDKAQWCLDEIAPVASRSDASRYLKSQELAMKARHMIVTENWEATPGVAELAAETRRDPASVDRKGTAAVLLANGMGAIERGDLDLAAEIEAGLAALVDHAVSGGGRGGVEHLSITHKEVSGLLRIARGETDEGLRLLKEASEIAESMVAPSGPPGESLRDGPVKPAHELYGEVLLAQGRAAEAAEIFEAGLLRMPKRPKLLYGSARAHAAAGDMVTARDRYDLLLKTPGHDRGLPGYDEATRFLRQSEEL